jgi:hypothetical protein
VVVQQEEKSASVEACLGHRISEEGPNLNSWREQVSRARRASQNAYVDFLDTLFPYYRESVRVAEGEASGGREWR